MKLLPILGCAATLALVTPLTFAQDCNPGETADLVSPVCVAGASQAATVPRNILVTFGAVRDLVPPTPGQATTAAQNPNADEGHYDDSGALHYRGVTYKALPKGSMAMSVVIGGTGDDGLFGDDPDGEHGSGLFDCKPVTRYVKTPLLATMGPAKLPMIGLEIVFDEPTPVFGFGFGFNDLNQKTDGVRTGPVGWVTLYDGYGKREKVIHVQPLFASRLLCCTEGDFDYVVHGKHLYKDRGEVTRAVIRLTADYIPFDPSTGEAGDIKFLGIDWVRYQRKELVSACVPSS